MCDTQHPDTCIRGEPVESMVRRLTVLFHVVEDVKRDQRPQAWQDTDLFLGTLGGSSAEAAKLLKKTKSDSRK